MSEVRWKTIGCGKWRHRHGAGEGRRGTMQRGNQTEPKNVSPCTVHMLRCAALFRWHMPFWRIVWRWWRCAFDAEANAAEDDNQRRRQTYTHRTYVFYFMLMMSLLLCIARYLKCDQSCLADSETNDLCNKSNEFVLLNIWAAIIFWAAICGIKCMHPPNLCAVYLCTWNEFRLIRCRRCCRIYQTLQTHAERRNQANFRSITFCWKVKWVRGSVVPWVCAQIVVSSSNKTKNRRSLLCAPHMWPSVWFVCG